MTILIGTIVLFFGLFFLALGMLFINYDLSPLKFIVKPEDVFKRPDFGLRIMLPGLILLFLAQVIFTK